MEGGCGGMVTLAVVWRVCRPAEVLLLLSQIPSLRSRCGWSQEAKVFILRWLPRRCDNSPPDPKSDCQSLFQVLSYPKPTAVHVYPGWAQCAATETDGGSFRQQRSTVAQVPSNTLETPSCQNQEYSQFPFSEEGE